MNKEEIAMKTFVDAANKYFDVFNGSFDGAFYSITNEVANELKQKYPFDPEMPVIYDDIIFFLRNDILSFISSQFKQNEMTRIIERIKEKYQENFDEWLKVILHIKNKIIHGLTLLKIDYWN